MAGKGQAHKCKGEIIARNGAKPEGAVVNSKTQLKKSVGKIQGKGAVKGQMDAQVLIAQLCGGKSFLGGLQMLDELWNFHAPDGEGVGRKDVGDVGKHRFGANEDHGKDEKSPRQRNKGQCNGKMGKEQGFTDLLEGHFPHSLF